LDKVADELGFRQQMDQLLAQRKQDLQSQMTELQSKLQAELKKKVDEFGKDPTDEQKKQLAQMQAQAIQRVRQAESQANNMLARARASLIEQIRTKLKVPIDKVANDRGIRVVASKRPDFVLFVAGVADITQDVISAARAAEFEALTVEESSDTDDKAKETDAASSEEDS
jgi:Skp family chaperone for outer membrane proteins